MTKEQREVLMERYAVTRTAVLAMELGVDYRTICRWASILGLKKSKDFKSSMSAMAALGYKRRHAGVPRGRGSTMLNDERMAYLREYFPTTPNKILANSLGVNDRTVRRWASKLGLTKNGEVMELHRISKMTPTPEQWFQAVATIRELFPDGRDAEIMERTGYCRYYICQIAKKYGILRNDAYRSSCHRGKKKKYSDEQVAAIAEYFPTHTDKECADHFGVGKTTVQYLARHHGWKKSKAHQQKVYASNMAAAHSHNKRMSNEKKQSI